jgi:ATP diphosphatase
MATESNYFDFDDVVAGITDKMVRRHPHIFGTAEQRAAGPQEGSWEAIKAQERSDQGDDSALAGVATALPALKRAQKLGKRASSVDFDWPDRVDELEQAVGTRNQADIEEEFGDLLFAVVNLARHLDVDPENALTVANHKFERRFRDMERAVIASGDVLQGQSLESLDKAWRAAKSRVG